MGLFYPKIFTTYFCGSLTLKMVDLTLIFKSMSKWTQKWPVFSLFENSRFTSWFPSQNGLKKFAATLHVKCLLLRVFRGIYFESYFILSECEFRILISVSAHFSFSSIHESRAHVHVFSSSIQMSRISGFDVFNIISIFSSQSRPISNSISTRSRVRVCVLELNPSNFQ